MSEDEIAKAMGFPANWRDDKKLKAEIFRLKKQRTSKHRIKHASGETEGEIKKGHVSKKSDRKMPKFGR